LRDGQFVKEVRTGRTGTAPAPPEEGAQ
jgi:hypothetical protein